MVFSSLSFVYLFLPIVILVYFCVPGKFRNAVLLGASLVFYFVGEQIYLLLMMLEITLTYVAGRLIEAGKGKKKKGILIAFLILSFGLLGLFKYADLIPATVNAFAGSEIINLLKLPLPIGISFYVFQSVSYGIDVYRGKYPAEKNPINLALYVSFFPQLIAGPVVRFETVREDLVNRKCSVEKLGDGLFRFCIGLGKKVLIADRLFAFCTEAASAGTPSVILAWTEGLAFLLYVYYDFSGYSDMAIGLAKCFGFNLPENFNYPLMSTGFGDFWRRWHISLGTWFRDYLYIPLGGSREGIVKHIRNLFIVWALTGLWHGASWNFVLWGLGFGIFISAEVLLGRRSGDPGKLWGNAKRILVLPVTIILFLFFRFTDISEAVRQLGMMFGAVELWSGDTGYLIGGSVTLLLIALIGATPLIKYLAKRIGNINGFKNFVPVFKAAAMLALLSVITAYLVDGSFSPFLYFRF